MASPPLGTHLNSNNTSSGGLPPTGRAPPNPTGNHTPSSSNALTHDTHHPPSQGPASSVPKRILEPETLKRPSTAGSSVPPTPSSFDSPGNLDKVHRFGSAVLGRADSMAAHSVHSFSTDAMMVKQADPLYNPAVLDAVFRSLPMGIILINGWGVIRALSKGGESMFLFSAWEIIGENVKVLMPRNVARRHDYYLSRSRMRVAKRVASVMGQSETNIMLDNVKTRDEEQGKLVAQEVTKTAVFGGQKREVLAVDKLGQAFAVEISVTALFLKNQLYYLGFVQDVRDLSKFQDLTVRQELMLRSMMDSSTMIRQLSGELSFRERFDSATVLYTDIVHYTETCVRLHHAHLVAEFLSEVFGIFDKILASSADATKIKTIGDCYVAAAGVPLACPDHAKILVHIAQAMLRGVMAYNRQVENNRSVESLLYRDSALADDTENDMAPSPRKPRVRETMPYATAASSSSRPQSPQGHNNSANNPRSPSVPAVTLPTSAAAPGDTKLLGTGTGLSTRLRSSSFTGRTSARAPDPQWRKLIVPLQIRTGIHSGPVVGGVFSQLRGGYDIYGSTANKAQKMEATSKAMRIHLSQETYDMLPLEMQQTCTLRPATMVPNFGVQDTYEMGPN